jgi:predicted ATPase
LHWIDPTSREVLDLTVEKITGLPVLLVATYRPEFQPPWVGGSQVTVVALNRLGRNEGATLVHRLAGNLGALPPDVVDEIVERTDGVPLFVEELVKAVVEAGADRGNVPISAVPPSSLAVPATLHASLLGRLDRLGPAAKNVAQAGAAIGRDFSHELLAAAAPLAELELQEALRRLVEAGLVFQRGAPPTAEYLFKHALVQDTAYSTLLRGPRQALHRRIAEAMEQRFPDLVATRPEIVAHHYAQAGLVEKSVACWGTAGHRSTARSAMAEAAVQLQKGLDQLALLPDTRERRRQELEFCSGLGAALMIIKGYAAPETGHNYARARGLWEQLGSPSEFLHVPCGQFFFHVNRCEFDLAERLAGDLLRLSRQHNDSAGLVLGHTCSGRALVSVGRFASARAHLEEALALYDPVFHRSLAHRVGIDPEVTSRTNLATVLFCLGLPDQALASNRAAVAAAQRLAHPPSLALSLGFGTIMLALIEDDTILGERLDELAAVAAEHGFSLYRASEAIFRGWLKVKSGGDLTEGLGLLRDGSTVYRGIGQEAWMPLFLAFEAAACEMAGQTEYSIALLDEALQIAARTGEHWFLAELNRQKGQLLLRRERTEAAEELYRKAMSIAREQEAKLWELRAATSLARLWGERGRRGDAHDLLAPVYGWFTEGFDTPDLKDAKALLDELT